ncbi:hypothetical protein V6N11_084149 [Hibiscus sabdariffa]|uniref:Peptidase M3A/M3B catalytic domain-containing protein n=2 Tax=Hibiscus sabdariffa TaxID=183260 RepID=A0ABR1Z741_9ROSI
MKLRDNRHETVPMDFGYVNRSTNEHYLFDELPPLFDYKIEDPIIQGRERVEFPMDTTTILDSLKTIETTERLDEVKDIGTQEKMSKKVDETYSMNTNDLSNDSKCENYCFNFNFRTAPNLKLHSLTWCALQVVDNGCKPELTGITYKELPIRCFMVTVGEVYSFVFTYSKILVNLDDPSMFRLLLMGKCIIQFIRSFEFNIFNTKFTRFLLWSEWDTVELPSQFMENWCYHRDTLMSIAKHYQTGESLSEEVLDFRSLRRKLLCLSANRAALPEDVKKELEDPQSRYNVGWSHGEEQLESGKPDLLKGSFYANPLLDVSTKEASWIQRYASYCKANILPQAALPELEVAFQALGNVIFDVGLLVAYH